MKKFLKIASFAFIFGFTSVAMSGCIFDTISKKPEIKLADWENAFDISKYSANYSTTSNNNYSVYVDGNKAKIVQDTTMYAELDNDICYMYTQDLDTEDWSKEPVQTDNYDSWTFKGVLASLEFENFTLDSKKNFFKAQDLQVAQFGTVELVKVYFNSDKELSKITLENQNSTDEIQFNYSDFTITLPEVGGGSLGGGDIQPPVVNPGEQVSETQWNNAFALTKYAYTLTSDMSGISTTMTVQVDGNNMKMTQNGQDSYIEIDGSNAYLYVFTELGWTKTPTQITGIESMLILSFFASTGISYSDFAYSSGIYTNSISEEEINITFENGKVKILQTIITQQPAGQEPEIIGYGSYEFDYTDFTLTLPDVDGGDIGGGDIGGGDIGGGDIQPPVVNPGQQVSETQWNDSFNLTKYAYTLTQNISGTTTTMAVQVDGNIIKMTQDGQDFYVEIDGSNTYMYVFDGTNWTKMPTEMMGIEAMLILSLYASSGLSYSDFAYSNGIYTMSSSEGIAEITFEDDKIKVLQSTILEVEIGQEPQIAGYTSYVFDHSDFTLTLPDVDE